MRDDAADQTKNLQQVRDLVENAKVWAIIEVSSASGGGATYLQQHGVPVTGWHVGVPAWSIDTNMFTFRLPTAADPGHVYNDRDATIMKNQGVTKVALIGGGNAQSVDFLSRNKQGFKSVGGLPVVYDNENVPAGTSDFTAEAQAIKDSGADGLLTGMDFIPNTSLSAQLVKDGVTMKELQFPGGYDSRVLSLPGMEGAFFGLEFKPFESNPPAFRAFDAAMAKGAIRNQVSYIGWLSGEITLQGIKDAGRVVPDPQGVHRQPPPRTRLHRWWRVRSRRPRKGLRQRVRVCLLRQGRSTRSSCRSSTASSSAASPSTTDLVTTASTS